MNSFIMSRPSPSPARPAHTWPRPGPWAAGRAGLGPKARPCRALVCWLGNAVVVYNFLRHCNCAFECT